MLLGLAKEATPLFVLADIHSLTFIMVIDYSTRIALVGGILHACVIW
jgi:hypothetical protein